MSLAEAALHKNVCIWCLALNFHWWKAKIFSWGWTKGALGMQTTYIKMKENRPVNCCKNSESKARALWHTTAWAGAELRAALHMKLHLKSLHILGTAHLIPAGFTQRSILPREINSLLQQFTDCHSFGLKKRDHFYSEWTLKIWHISDTRTWPSILIKICSLSTPAVQYCICQLYPVFQSNVDSMSESCRYTVWRKLPGSFPEDKLTVNVRHYLYTAQLMALLPDPQLSTLLWLRDAEAEAPAFSYSLFWTILNWNGWVSRGSDYLLFPAGLNNNPDFSELPTTQVRNQQTDILMFDSLCCSVVRCHQASLQLLWHHSQWFHHEALGTFLRCGIVECLWIYE